MHNPPPALNSPAAQKNENVKTCLGVLGAASMVGECLLPLLIQTDWRVLAFSRRPVGQPNEKVEWRQIALPNPGHLAGVAETIEAWICLAPIMALPDYFGMLEAYGARRVVALSSTSQFTKMDSSDPAERDGVASLVAAEAGSCFLAAMAWFVTTLKARCCGSMPWDRFGMNTAQAVPPC